MNNVYLSYSGRKSYSVCPRQYHFRYILRDKRRVEHKYVMFGLAIGKVFEWFYEQKLWSTPDPTASTVSVIDKAISFIYSSEEYMKGTDHSYETSLREDMFTFVPEGVKIIKEHEFLTPYSRAEVDLTVSYAPPGSSISLKMGGRADFIHGKDLSNIWITDGKASKYRDKYVDSDQLIWYATQHYIKYHVAPSRLGFVFWCFPDSPVSWVEYNSDSMRILMKNTFEIAQKILDNDFVASPSSECSRCPYKNGCDDGTVYLAKKKVESVGRIDGGFFDIERV